MIKNIKTVTLLSIMLTSAVPVWGMEEGDDPTFITSSPYIPVKATSSNQETPSSIDSSGERTENYGTTTQNQEKLPEISVIQDDPKALYELGKKYAQELIKVTSRLHGAANQGNEEAAFHLGVLLLEIGINGKKDERTAYRRLIEAAEKGHERAKEKIETLWGRDNGEAHYQVALMQIKPDSENPPYTNAARQLFQKAIEKRHPEAKDALEKMDQDLFKKYFRLAEEQPTNTSVHYTLGMIYMEGLGAPKDMVRAVQHLKNAAQQDHSFAKLTLGLIYAGGLDISQNTVEAKNYLRNCGFPKKAKEMCGYLDRNAPQEEVQRRAQELFDENCVSIFNMI